MIPIFPSMSIDVMRGTTPTIDYEYRDRAGDAIDISAGTIKLAVKRSLSDADAKILFDITGAITSGTTGMVTFDFSGHTGLAGSYPAEIRRWGAGSTLRLPLDAYPCTFNVSESVVRSEGS
jgi:hypothetical protein